MSSDGSRFCLRQLHCRVTVWCGDGIGRHLAPREERRKACHYLNAERCHADTVQPVAISHLSCKDTAFSASQCMASHSTPPLLTGWDVVGGMLVEVRDSCVAGAVCDQTDDQLREQVPGSLWLYCGSFTSYRGYCLLTEPIGRFYFRLWALNSPNESSADEAIWLWWMRESD